MSETRWVTVSRRELDRLKAGAANWERLMSDETQAERIREILRQQNEQAKNILARPPNLPEPQPEEPQQ